MTQNEIEAELENLKQQLLLLQKEHGNTRGGWINWLRRTGLLLALFGGAILYGIWHMAIACAGPFQPCRDHVGRHGDFYAWNSALSLALQPTAHSR
jgi:hypothetical protein